MKKWKKLRGSLPAKVIAFLLALILAVSACAGAGGVLYLISRYGGQSSFDPMTERYGYVSQRESEFRDYLFLYLHRDGLTRDGQARYEYLEAYFRREETNFRVRLTDDTGREILSNAEDEEPTDSSGIIEYTGYSLGCDRMLSYYLSMDKTADWKLVHGTTKEWLDTPYASSFYYNKSDIYDTSEMSEEPAVDEDTTDSAVDEAAYEDTADSDEDDTETPTEAADEVPEEDEYYYFVYCGEFQTYYLQYWVDTTYLVQDEFSESYDEYENGQSFYRQWCTPMIALTGISVLLFLSLLAWLTWSWGWDHEALALRGLNRLPVEWVLAALGGGGCLAILLASAIVAYNFFNMILTFGILGFIGAMVCLPAWLIVTAQLKTRTILKRSLCCRLLRWVRSKWQKLCQGVRNLAEQWPLYWKVAVCFAAYMVLYLLWMSQAVDIVYYWGWPVASTVVLLLPIVPLAIFACKWALDWAKLRQGVKQMVEGRLICTIDSGAMLPDLKKHAQDLSNLSAGLSKAVEEQVKSQRFKTELITNVSHDLKTPLTSIINYVDLLKKLDIQDETARSYIDVLDRKSQRLKTLTEDLVEASKAASGTIAVNLERLDLTQLVNQAVAEYDERLEHSALTPIVNTPKEPCMVMADGRHLWRILDNLLGNCTKYAMPGTRVYLDVARVGEKCSVTVKNISADPLNIPAEELMKRFVRGDSARSTEGSGLGLSIARNLAGAQHGDFDLVVDGDLFKVIVTFPLAPEPPEKEPKPKLASEPKLVPEPDAAPIPAAPQAGSAEAAAGAAPPPDPIEELLKAAEE